MFISKIINKEGITKIEYIAMCLLIWCRWAKLGNEMDTMAYICKRDHTAYGSTGLISKEGDLIQ